MKISESDLFQVIVAGGTKIFIVSLPLLTHDNLNSEEFQFQSLELPQDDG